MRIGVKGKSLLLIGVVGSLSACGGQPDQSVNETASADGAKARTQCSDGTSVAWNKTCPTPASLPSKTVVAPGTAEYDTSIGMGVDSEGFALLPLRSGAKRYFVNSTAGSDANDCASATQPAKPLKSISAGLKCVADSYSGGNAGDQVLLAEGTRYSEALPWVSFKGGNSAQYPTVIQSYDPADPLNEAKYGRGDQRGARPVLTAPQGQVSNGIYSYIAIRGLDFNPGNVPGPSLMFVGQSNYILIENNIFRFTSLSFDKANQAQAQHHVIRGNSFYGQWNTGGRTGGIYEAGTDGVTMEDNVFWHCGWRVGGSRDDTIENGGATVFSHSFYMQTNTSSLIRRNLSADAAGDGGIARGDVVFTENLSIDNPSAIGLGGGPSYNTDRPNGVSIQASYNAAIGDADVNSTHQLGWGMIAANGTAGSSIHHNLILRTRNPSATNVMALANIAPFDQPSYMDFHHNVIFLWTTSGQTYQASGFGYDAQVHTTYDYNVWDNPSDGTNKSNASAAFPNTYTAASLYLALGYADKASFINYVINHPEARIQRNARTMLFAGYGM